MTTNAELAARAQQLAAVNGVMQADPVFTKLAAQSPFVPGRGPLDAPMMVIAEAPGAEEVKPENLRPLVGPAGKLFSELLAEAGIPEAALRIDNVLPWRPPGNRTPYPFERQAAHPYLMARIAISRPATLVTLGATAWMAVTENSQGAFSERRGTWLTRQFLGTWAEADAPPWHCEVLPLYHPSHVLQAPRLEKDKKRAELLAGLRSVLEG